MRKLITIFWLLAATFWSLTAFASGQLHVALTTVALSYPTPDRGEAPEARAERLYRISEAVVQAAERATCSGVWKTIDAPCRRLWPGSTIELSAVAWGLGYLESGFAEWVHAGRCRIKIGECDARKVRGQWVVGAKSPWQLQRTAYTNDVWDEIEGVGEVPTFNAAWAAMRVVSAARRMCTYRRPNIPWLHAMISVYATGGHCTYPRAEKRAAFIRRIEGKIRSELKEK